VCISFLFFIIFVVPVYNLFVFFSDQTFPGNYCTIADGLLAESGSVTEFTLLELPAEDLTKVTKLAKHEEDEHDSDGSEENEEDEENDDKGNNGWSPCLGARDCGIDRLGSLVIIIDVILNDELRGCDIIKGDLVLVVQTVSLELLQVVNRVVEVDIVRDGGIQLGIGEHEVVSGPGIESAVPVLGVLEVLELPRVESLIELAVLVGVLPVIVAQEVHLDGFALVTLACNVHIEEDAKRASDWEDERTVDKVALHRPSAETVKAIDLSEVRVLQAIGLDKLCSLFLCLRNISVLPLRVANLLLVAVESCCIATQWPRIIGCHSRWDSQQQNEENDATNAKHDGHQHRVKLTIGSTPDGNKHLIPPQHP